MTARTLTDLIGTTGAKPNLYFNIGAINANEQLAVKIAQVITAYSYIEAELLRVVTELCTGNPEVVAAIWAMFRNSGQQDGMLKAVMGLSVSDEDYGLFCSVVERVVAPSRATRNQFAHHLWGQANGFKQYALLVDPKVALRQEASSVSGIRALWREESRAAMLHGVLPPRPTFEEGWDRWDPDFIKAYDMADLSDELLRAVDVMNALYYLRFALRDKGPEGEQARNVLADLPELRSHQNRVPSSASPPPPPGEDLPQ